MFIPPRIMKSPACAVRLLADEKKMSISHKYWRALDIGSQNARYTKVDLLAANAVLIMEGQGLKEKFTEHAFTENHGGRWIRLVAKERGGGYRKIMIWHAEDKERHGLLLLQLLRNLGHEVSDDILGPESYIEPYYMKLHETYGQDLYQFMCLVHAAAVRTLMYVQQVLHITTTYADDEDTAKINDTFAILYNDEKFHIRYSANIIGMMMDDGADPQALIDAFGIVQQQTSETIETLISSYKKKAA